MGTWVVINAGWYEPSWTNTAIRRPKNEVLIKLDVGVSVQ